MKTARIPPREFDCADCGTRVFTFIRRRKGTTLDLCAVCDFLRCIEDAGERQTMRRLLSGGDHEPG